VAVLCFAYLAVFGFAVKGILKKQGIDYETKADDDLTPLETFPEGGIRGYKKLRYKLIKNIFNG
jgi:FHS family L-fucose permease-like MFS transporter